MHVAIDRLSQRPTRIHILGALLTTITVAALAGGALLLMDRSGSLLGLSVADMGAAPFADYTIPGTVLLILFGVLPTPVLVGLWRGRRWARELSGMIGAALAAWVTAQVIWFGPVSPIQALVWIAGVALLMLGGAPAWRRNLS
jgi:hypothetical protein